MTNIQPEHVRKAHVNRYAGEVQFKLGVMCFIWLLVALCGCASGPTLVELEDQLFACTRDKVIDCRPYMEAVEAKNISIEKRKARRLAKEGECTPGAICFYGDDASRALVNGIPMRGMQR